MRSELEIRRKGWGTGEVEEDEEGEDTDLRAGTGTLAGFQSRYQGMAQPSLMDLDDDLIGTLALQPAAQSLIEMSIRFKKSKDKDEGDLIDAF